MELAGLAFFYLIVWFVWWPNNFGEHLAQIRNSYVKFLATPISEKMK